MLIPVPENTDASSLVIAHYLGKGEYEYFVMGQNMNIRDGYLEIMTASFSPFNVGGGQQIVGIGTGSGNHKPSTGQSGTTGKTKDESDSFDKIKEPDNTRPGRNTNNHIQINRNPKTGDNTEIMKYVILAGVSVIFVVVVIAARKNKNDK